MLGHGEISKVIAWSADSIYSHAAIVADDGDLIEAAPAGVRRVCIAERLEDSANYHFVDAFRPLTADARALTEADRAAVLCKEVSLLGTPYPLDALATLGLLIAIRGKLPQGHMARLLFRLALDHIVNDDPTHQMCSEVVYRSLAECDTAPRRKLAPEIVVTPPTHWPFPHIDWPELIRELHDLRRRQVPHLDIRALEAGEAAEPGADHDLENLLQRARRTCGIDSEQGRRGETVAQSDPNPKLVTPLDLATTPSHECLGRLMGPPV